jgi:imidazolonepropionase-like amidohydrolase
MTAAFLVCALLADTWAIEHVRVHTGLGTTLEDATVTVKDGVIVEVGNKAPSGVRKTDGKGKVLTPGFIEAYTQTGLHEVGLEPSTRDDALEKDFYNPAFSASSAYNPRSARVALAREEGVTGMVVAPVGGVVSGSGVYVKTVAVTASSTEQPKDVAMFGDVGDGAKEKAGGARGGIWMALDKLFFEVFLCYANFPVCTNTNRPNALSIEQLQLQAVTPLLEQKIPFVVRAHKASDIEQAVRFAVAKKIRVVILGGTEAWMVADLLKEHNIPVVVKPSMQEPFSFEALYARDDLAAFLVKAGVKVVVSSDDDSQNIRRLRQEAGIAVAHGLPYQEALKAITSTPAEIFGQKDTGAIAQGKKADMVLWSGDPLEIGSQALEVYIEGVKQPMVNRQWLLMRRYKPSQESAR